MRADKKRNLDAVQSEYVKNPLVTQEQVANDLWLWEWTVNRAVKEMEENGGIKDDRIISLTDWDFDLMVSIQKRKFTRMKDMDIPVSDNDLNQWDREAKARYSLFRGTVTDPSGWLKENSIKEKSDDELLKIIWQ